MNPDTSFTSLPNRMLNLASIGLLAITVFGLARLGFGVVPVWILAVPFVLLACLDIEGRFSRVRSFAGRMSVIAFHFVIVATVVAAHQQVGGMRDSGYKMQDASGIAAKAETGGCGAGGECGGSGGCGGACGASGGTRASASQGVKSACGCGGGKAVASSRSSNSKRSAAPAATAAAKRTADASLAYPPQVSLKLPPRLPVLPNLPLSAGSTQPKTGGEITPPLPSKSPASPPSPPLITLPPQAPAGSKTALRAVSPASGSIAPSQAPLVRESTPPKQEASKNLAAPQPGSAAESNASSPAKP